MGRAQTKAATMNYVKSLAKQLAVGHPRQWGRSRADLDSAADRRGRFGAEIQNFGSTTVFGRPGQPVELASIYVQLAAADASFATGNIYGAGGGQGQP